MNAFKRIIWKGTKPIIRMMLFVWAVAPLAFLCLFSYYQIRITVDSSTIVNQTNLALLRIDQSLSIVKDAETAQRGSLLERFHFIGLTTCQDHTAGSKILATHYVKTFDPLFSARCILKPVVRSPVKTL